ncbi:MAG: pyridoxal phosphate-dependent aminotransferase [Butyricicoccus sp.]|nr:pyridoxal phosphate-dependent aminotransferase [Butyricicoccus sp.]
MLPEKTLAWGKSRSCIRELSEYAARRKAEIGAENVFDFSLGNPSIPAPEGVNKAIAELLQGDSVALHGYTTAAGLVSLREAIAEDLNKRFDAHMSAGRLYVTCGAAAGLAISLRAILLPGDEVVVLAPFFPEYRVFVEASGGILRVVPPREGDFQLDEDAFAAALSEKTKAVIVNSPNNPSGVILSRGSIERLSDILRRHGENVGAMPYLICDEPYRELVYDGSEVPYLPAFYDNTIVCYSFSKSMSIPGERIGYIALGAGMEGWEDVCASVLGAGRALGYVNPPSLFQRVVEKCIGQTSDMSKYRENRDLLCGMLRALGFECIEPQGAFYLFMRSPEPDARAFSERAKRFELMLVPGDDFGCPGYVRIAYCVSKELIERSRGAFEALARDYGL